MNNLELLEIIKENLNINIPYIKNSYKKGDAVLYSSPFWDEKEILSAINSLLNGKWISSGEKVHAFEREFSKINNQKYAVMVNSGSSANLLLIASVKKYYQIADNSEVILSAVGFPTTYSAVILNNLKPVFIDIEFDTLNFNIEKIEEKITDKTKIIFVSPVLGNPPDYDKLDEICKKYNLLLLTDCCDSLGSKWDNKFLPELSIASSYSFYPAHHFCTAEGGAITSNNKEIIDIARSMAWWGRDCYCVGSANLLPNGTCQNRFYPYLKPYYSETIDHKYYFTNIGYNLKPLDLQGAIGLEQIKKGEEIHSRRINSKNTITKIFTEKIKNIKSPKVLGKSFVSWFGTPFICESPSEKRKLVSFLESKKIQTRNYFAGNILLHPAYREYGNYLDYPEANKVLDLVFFIGASPHYNNDTFEYISEVLDEYISIG